MRLRSTPSLSNSSTTDVNDEPDIPGPSSTTKYAFAPALTHSGNRTFLRNGSPSGRTVQRLTFHPALCISDDTTWLKLVPILRRPITTASPGGLYSRSHLCAAR